MSRNSQIYFGPFRLDTADRELFRGGERIHLRPKAYAVLQYLAERPGRTVTKDELSCAVWPEGGDNDVIKGCVHEIRMKLGDDRSNPWMIETRPRIGYRFIADVRTERLSLQLAGVLRLEPGLGLAGSGSEPRPLVLPDPLKSLLEAYCYALKAGCYDEACQMFLERQLGECLFWRGHYALADDLLDPLIQAYQNRRWQATPGSLALLYTLAGMIGAKSCNTKQAAVQFQKATDLSAPDRSFIPAGYLSEVEAESGRFFEAFEALERARTLEERAGMKESYRIAGRMGYINAAVGEVETAAGQLSRAIKESESEDPSYLCLFLRVRGDLHVQMGHKDDAFGDYSRALDVALNHRFKDYEGHVLRGLGDVYRLQNDLRRSAENYGAALTIASDTGYLWLEAEARIGLARLAIDNGDYENASREANVAMKIASTGGWMIQEIQAHLAHAELSAIRRSPVEARSHTKIAGDLIGKSGHYWSRKYLG
jgi:DNA-binding winged helix-turn-helix (wHTH) protein/tetratricopeptide (TPR) repeat protein